MRERPILFSGPMVRAILDGRKTQTRRVIDRLSGFGPITEFGVTSTHGWDWTFRDKSALWNDLHHDRLLSACPYGQPGDRLWVRETFTLESSVDGNEPPHADGRPIRWRPDDDVDGWLPLWTQPHYRATDPAPDLCCENERCRQCVDNDSGPHWRPSIHMPRWASRITLEITGVRVERLQAISAADAVAEGLVRLPASGRYVVNPGEQYFGGASHSPVEVFADLWERINGDGSWDANPWVWVIEFQRIEGAQA